MRVEVEFRIGLRRLIDDAGIPLKLRLWLHYWETWVMSFAGFVINAHRLHVLSTGREIRNRVDASLTIPTPAHGFA